MDQRPRIGGALMARPSHSGVTVYNFDPKVQARTGKRKPYVIRWRVGGKQSYKSFQYVAEARQFHARLLTAASNGEQFDPVTKLPTSWGTPNALTVAEVAYKWFRENYTEWAPRTRSSNSEPMVDLMMRLVKSNATKYDSAEMKRTIKAWLAADPLSAMMPPWLVKYSLPISSLTPQICSTANTEMLKKKDGTPKARSTQQRYRANIHALMDWAVEQRFITTDPWPTAKRERKSTRSQKTKSAKTVLPTPDEVKSCLDQVVKKGSKEGAKARQVLLYIIYYAGLRPSEAVALHIEDCTLPDTGWGVLDVHRARVDCGAVWSADSAKIGATKTDARQVPIPQELVVIIKENIGTRTAGLVAPSERNTMMSVNNLTKTWISVRTNPKWRVYDLRAACASLRVNSGRAPAIVAAEMGHSIEVLFERYLGSTANDASGGLDKIEDALNGG